MSKTSKFEWNKERTLCQGLIGGAILSPGIHLFVTRVMQRLNFSGWNYLAGIAARVSIHQVCTMPFIQFTLLFGSGAIQHKSLDKGLERFKAKWRTGFTASLCYWPVINTFMYMYVPGRFFNLYCDVFVLMFSIVMSYIANNKTSDLAIIKKQTLSQQ